MMESVPLEDTNNVVAKTAPGKKLKTKSAKQMVTIAEADNELSERSYGGKATIAMAAPA
jgi:hypothetical protein